MVGDEHDRPGGSTEAARLRTVGELLDDAKAILDTLDLPALRYDRALLQKVVQLTLRYQCGAGRQPQLRPARSAPRASG